MKLFKRTVGYSVYEGNLITIEHLERGCLYVVYQSIWASVNPDCPMEHREIEGYLDPNRTNVKVKNEA